MRDAQVLAATAIALSRPTPAARLAEIGAKVFKFFWRLWAKQSRRESAEFALTLWPNASKSSRFATSW